MGRLLPSERTLRILAAVVGLIGLGIAGYIMVEQVQGGYPQCGGDGCADVLASDYSKLFGIPLYYLGVAGYLTILGATAMRGDRGRLLAFVLSFFGFGISVYLTYLQFVVIEGVCLWCRASAIAMSALFLVCLARLLGYYGTDHDPSDGWRRQTAVPEPEDGPLRALR